MAQTVLPCRSPHWRGEPAATAATAVPGLKPGATRAFKKAKQILRCAQDDVRRVPLQNDPSPAVVSPPPSPRREGFIFGGPKGTAGLSSKAPEERQTLAHGVSHGRTFADPPHPGPLPAGEGGPRGGGCGACSQGLRPGLKSSAPGRGCNPAGGARGFQHQRIALPICSHSITNRSINQLTCPLTRPDSAGHPLPQERALFFWGQKGPQAVARVSRP